MKRDDKIILGCFIAIVLTICIVVIAGNWESSAYYKTHNSYTSRCYINDEWVDVDHYRDNWSEYVYWIDGQRYETRGDITCTQDHTTTTTKHYRRGIKDILGIE